MNYNYVNYHSHKMYTNIIIGDSPTYYEDYIDRALELNQTVITSVEHGFQGHYFLLNELICKKNIELQKRRDKGEKDVPQNLKFVFGTEAYWVKDRHEKDKSNCHMIILAKTENARRKINLMLAKANEDGMFNGRPRIDFELLFELPKDEVLITSACIGYWNKYEDIDDITLKFKEYFGDNFYLEVQNHNTKKQIELNKHILGLHYKYNIPIIAGMDSHYIFEKDSELRNSILQYKHIFYEDEEGWFLDYPSYDEAINRFKNQGVLQDSEIYEAMNNTNIILDFDNIDLGLKTIEKLNKDNEKEYELFAEVKLPTIYKDLSQQEKDNKLIKITYDEWLKFKEFEKVKTEDEPMYLEGIKYELGEIIKTGMGDYFTLHYEGIRRGKEKGGKVTKRGRGSAVGFFVNTLLGFSKVDRFKAPIKLYPERFLTSDRILKTRSLPDIDNNIDRQEPFVEAFRELLGYHGIYPMIAFEALKKSSAIKLYMGANNEPANIQDEVSKQLQKYDEKLKYCETDEDREEVYIEDYISEEYLHYVDDSKKYQGIIISKKAHACGHLLLNGDIREEIGLFRCESKTSKKSVLTACIDGTMADHYKYLKTDLLIVDVVGLTEDIWNRIGEESISNNKLEKILASEEGKKAWDIYANGYTLCVNQCEKEGTRKKCMKYKMKDTAELSAFVAGIRPGFKSLINNFLSRNSYTTGVPQLDEILKDSYSYMLYQESIMAFLNWLGIDMKETYDIVKKISKKIFLKYPEQMEALKEKVKPQWIKNTGSLDKFDETFQVVNDAGSYAFNSAHSYCVGNDGAEIAYLKAYYPFETYEVCLNRFDKKKNKDKVALLKQEMKEAFDINEGELKWGRDNRQYTLDKENNCIHPCLSSIKGMGQNVANELYDLHANKKYTNFLDLLIDIKEKTSVDDSMLDTLIKLRYFSEFGKTQKLLNIVNTYNSFYKKDKGTVVAKKQFKKENLKGDMFLLVKKYANNETEKTFTKVNVRSLVDEIISNIEDKEVSIKTILKTEIDFLGYISYIDEKYQDNVVAVTNIKINGWGTPFIDLYSIKTGKSTTVKVDKKYYNEKPLSEYEIIVINNIDEKNKKRKIDGKWIVIDEKELVLNNYSRIIIDEV